MEKRTALITGSSRGIGRETALTFARKGYNVIINYKENEDAANETLDAVGALTRAIKVRADVGDPVQVAELYRQSKQAFGFVDTVVNNAGISHTKLLIDETDAELDRVFKTNLLGMMYVARAFLPDMMSSRFGRIVNISSIWGQTGGSMEAAYSASKAGVIGFTKALSKEAAPMGVTVNAVAPGLILTDMTKPLGDEIIKKLERNIMVGRAGRPSDVAAAIAFLASVEAEYMTGEVISVNGDFLSTSIE